MRLSVIGTGYVGLVSGVCLSELGHDVVCVDIDADKVARINGGECPIHEDGLPELMAGVLGSRFSATTDLEHAVQSSDMTLIAVGTPFGEERIDLGQIESAARSIGEAMATKDGYHVVAVKSTVVPGTTEDVVLPILEASSGKTAGPDFGVGMNPEFLREGVAVPDFMNPDRIVLGGIDFNRPLLNGDARLKIAAEVVDARLVRNNHLELVRRQPVAHFFGALVHVILLVKHDAAFENGLIDEPKLRCLVALYKALFVV